MLIWTVSDLRFCDIKLFRTGRLLVTVENRSDRPVFVSYLPGIDSERSQFALIGLEKLNPKTEQYEPSESSDFDPGWQTLPPQKKFDYQLTVNESGMYRANLRYFINTKFKERTDANYRLFYSDPESWRADIKDVEVIAKTAIGRSLSNSIAI